MKIRLSSHCTFTGASLVVAKLATVAVEPAGATTRIFPYLAVGVVALTLLRIGWRARSASGAPGRRWIRGLLVSVGWVMTAFILTMAWVDHGLVGRTHAGVYDGLYKVWAARGLVSDGSDGSPVRERNSIESVAHAFDRGAMGTEVDVYYDPEMGKFVVSHGKLPYDRPNGALLTLDALFDAIGGDGAFWLDWKKLRHLDEEELRAALERLERIIDRDDLRGRVYVEGEAPLSLREVKRAGFLTIYDCRPPPDTNLFASVILDMYKAIYYFGGFTVLGMNSGTREAPIYGPEARHALREIPVFLYHVPDDESFLKELVACRDVRVILLDDHTADRFGFVAGE